jgi:uncharacterized protein with beta-barrel porin domain
MKKRKTGTTLLLGLAVLALASLVTAQIAGVQRKIQAAGNKTCLAPNTLRTQKALLQQQNQQPEQATVVQEGVMTERQKKHAKLFKRYATLTGGKKLKDSGSQTGDVNVSVEIGDRPVNRTFDLNTYLRDNACKADAIVIGTINNKASQLTEDGSFTFTEYDVTVDEVLKDNSKAPLAVNSHITVARAGGVVQLNGRTIRAFDRSERPLGIAGRFLLFLQYVPEAGDYKSYTSDAGDTSFRLHGDKLFQVSDEARPLGEGRDVDATSFLNQVRSAAYGPCSN